MSDEKKREEVAKVLETVAKDGLPGPRDLDVALDAIFSIMQDPAPVSSHTLHKCDSEDCPCCSGGLAWCAVCGGAEGSLPKECPGVTMSPEQLDAVYAGKLNFVNGMWVRPSTT